MFHVLVAQSDHLFQLGSCIYQGMELHFVFHSTECLVSLNKHHYDALVLQMNLNKKDNHELHEILQITSKKKVAVFCTASHMSEEVMSFLFTYKIHHYFAEPVSFQEVLMKLGELKGHEENKVLGKKTSQLLHSLGIPSSMLGYNYIMDSIISCYYQEEYLKGITTSLYPRIAQEYQTTATAVEKSIRHAIDIAFSRSDSNYLYEFFKGTIRSDKAKATNSQFISMCVEYIKMNGSQQ